MILNLKQITMKKEYSKKIQMGNLTIRFLLLYTNLIFSLENKQKQPHFTINLVHAFQGSTARNFVKISLIINNIIIEHKKHMSLDVIFAP